MVVSPANSAVSGFADEDRLHPDLPNGNPDWNALATEQG
jgi:hypothetical protein